MKGIDYEGFLDIIFSNEKYTRNYKTYGNIENKRTDFHSRVSSLSGDDEYVFHR
jgi:hypothetical protein